MPRLRLRVFTSALMSSWSGSSENDCSSFCVYTLTAGPFTACAVPHFSHTSLSASVAVVLRSLMSARMNPQGMSRRMQSPTMMASLMPLRPRRESMMLFSIVSIVFYI